LLCWRFADAPFRFLSPYVWLLSTGLLMPFSRYFRRQRCCRDAISRAAAAAERGARPLLRALPPMPPAFQR